MTHLLCTCLTSDYKKRPSPQECLSLLVKSDIGIKLLTPIAIILTHLLVSKDIQHKWLSQLTSLSVVPTIPSKITSCSDEQFIIDIYLGSHLKSPAPVYCLLPGWLGSCPCKKDASYADLIRDYISFYIPVNTLFLACIQFHRIYTCTCNFLS